MAEEAPRAPGPGRDLSDWMQQLPEEARDRPLCRLAIPGSHDSFTYSLVETGEAGPDQPPCVRRLVRRFPRLSGRLLLRWSRTQGAGLASQLRGGVRYFDLRLDAVEGEEGRREYRILHCLLGDRARELLLQVRTFLRQHTGEVVVLDLQHTYSFTTADHQQLAAFILETFAGLLHPWTGEGGRASLRSLQRSGRRAVVIYPALAGRCPLLWPRPACPTPWPDTTSTRTLRACLDKGLREREPATLFVSQGVLTPSLATVALHPLSGLRDSCARRANTEVLAWLQGLGETMPGMPMVPNIVITDFVLGDPVSVSIMAKLLVFNYLSPGDMCGNERQSYTHLFHQIVENLSGH